MRQRVRISKERREWYSQQEREYQARQTEFYCSWGHHRTIKDVVINEHFDNGTMCWECQLKITENIRLHVPMPELTAALREQERKRMVKDRTAATTVKKIQGDAEALGFVYYIRINNQIKIGYAKDITKRMRHYPPGSELIAAEPGTMRTELERHQKFRNYLARGREWFTESERLKEHMAELVAKHGDPSALAYEFTKGNAANT